MEGRSLDRLYTFEHHHVTYYQPFNTLNKISILSYFTVVYLTENLLFSSAAAAAAAKSLQSYPTLCDPIDGSPPGSPRPWDSPGKNTGVGCHFLLQCMKVKSESEIALFLYIIQICLGFKKYFMVLLRAKPIYTTIKNHIWCLLSAICFRKHFYIHECNHLATLVKLTGQILLSFVFS